MYFVPVRRFAQVYYLLHRSVAEGCTALFQFILNEKAGRKTARP
jgi:hypothetical protein